MRLSRDTLLTALLVVAALTIGTVVTGRLPSADDVTDRPFVHLGTLGEPVQQRTGTFTVTKVDASHNLDVVQFGTVVASPATNGVFLVLSVELIAAGEARYVATDDLRIIAADGREFGGAVPGSVPCGPAQPGLPLECIVGVEIVPDALAGAHLRLPADARDYVGPAEQEVADIDLTITDADAGRLQAATARIQLGAPTPKGA